MNKKDSYKLDLIQNSCLETQIYKLIVDTSMYYIKNFIYNCKNSNLFYIYINLFY